MDPQTLLVAVAVFVLSALLIYLISIFGMREKSFDEVMAEQKRRQEEELQKSRSEKKVEKEKKHKGPGRRKVDKAKDKGAQYCQAELPDIAVPVKNKTLEYEPDPEIISPGELPIREAKQSKSKGKKAKSILVNKDEKTPVSSEVHAPLLFTRHTPPKDELELKHSHDDPGHNKATLKLDKKEERKTVTNKREEKHSFESVKKVTEDIVVQHITIVQSSLPQPSEPIKPASEKKKNKLGSGDIEGGKSMNTSQLMESIRSASLNDGEVQTIIDILLNKQQGSATVETWSKKSQKGDPVALLRRQLEEKERSLQEAQQQAMSAGDKLKEVRQEMAQEKARYSTMEKTTKDKLTLQHSEIQALHNRMQQTHETHTVEKNSLQARVSQMENQMGSGNQNLLQKLTDENKQLKDSLSKIQAESTPASERIKLTKKIQLLETELANSHVKLNASENTKKTLESKVVRYEEQVRSFDMDQKDTATVLTKQLEEVGQQLRKTESQKASLSTDLHKATEAMKTAQTECQSLRTKLKELERTLSGADEKTQGLQAKLEASEQEKAGLRASVHTLEQRLDDGQKRQSQKDQELNELRVENRALADQLKKETERQQGEGQEEPPKAAGAPNGDIHHESKPEKNTIQLAEHEKLLGEKQKEILRLTSDLNLKHEEIVKLSQDVETQRKKNNDIREKNWKAMEALNKAESSIQERLDRAINSTMEKTALQLAEYESADRAVLQRLFPEIKVGSSLAHKEWMSSFEKEATVCVTSMVTKANSPAVDPSLEEGLRRAEEKASDAMNRLRAAEEKALDATNRLNTADQRAADAVIRSKESDVKASDATNRLTAAEEKALDVTNKLKIAEQRAADAINRLKEAEKQASKDTDKVTEAEERTANAMNRYKEAEESTSDAMNRYKEVDSRVDVLEKQLSEANQKCRLLEEEVREQNQGQGQAADIESQLSEVESQREKLDSQVKEYRKVLSETEDKLQQLEKSVESEEQKWTSRLQVTEQELNNAKVELSSLREENKQFSGSREMEEKVIKLESQLKSSEDNYITVQQQLTESQHMVTTLHRRLAGAENSNSSVDLKATVDSLHKELATSEDRRKQLEVKVVQLEKQVSSVEVQDGDQSDLDALRKLIADLRGQMEEEKKRTKEMSSSIVRLNGTLKTGQDALAAEQTLVKQLQDQLAKDSPVSPADVEEVKAKLHDTQKQLEKEIMANRQLNQRLAASVGNDVGTSV